LYPDSIAFFLTCLCANPGEFSLTTADELLDLSKTLTDNSIARNGVIVLKKAAATRVISSESIASLARWTHVHRDTW